MKDTKDTVLLIEGMDCTNCALGIKKQLEKLGMEQVDVNFTTSEVHFSTITSEQIETAIQRIKSMGYKITANLSEDETVIKKGLDSIEWKFYFSLLFTIPLLSAMFIPLDFLHNQYFQLSLCIPVFALGLWHFGKSAYYSVRSGVPNMDVLIVIGTTAAFIYSLTGTILQLGHDYMFYETPASIISLIFLGNFLEHKAIKRTTTAIDDLVNMQKVSAKLVTSDNGTEQISIIEAAKIRVNDVLLYNSGDKIASDGIIIWGEGNIDESTISGESLGVDKPIGSDVIGGTILISGNIKVKATAVGQNSVLGKIIELVKNAQKDKPALQNLADKISAIFVPVVLLIAVLTFLLNYFAVDIGFQHSLLRSIAVLVIACPCALGLAIPTAVVVGVGRVAKQGVLIRGAVTLQKISEIKKIVFDKTGTLTTGNFKIKKIKTYGKSDPEVRSILFSLEKYSTHPLAVSLVSELQGSELIELTGIEENNGIGIKAKDASGNIYEAGSYRITKHLTGENPHDMYLLQNDILIGGIDLLDEIKPEAKGVIDYLRSKNIRTYILSGDKREKCEFVASQLGIDEIFYEKLPAEKLNIVAELNKNNDVAMVGDGINDAPALSKAGLGISLTNATQIAIKSAQVILLNGKINLLTKAYGISTITMKIIRQNLFWAFFYNIIAIPIAAMGFLDPMIAAASMALSDVIVVANSLRLRSKKLD
jgi:P-type Cu+ transporter